MSTTSNETIAVKPSINVSGTTAKPDPKSMAMVSQSISLFSAGLLIVGGPNEVPGQTHNGIDLLKERNYGNG